MNWRNFLQCWWHQRHHMVDFFDHRGQHFKKCIRCGIVRKTR